MSKTDASIDTLSDEGGILNSDPQNESDDQNLSQEDSKKQLKLDLQKAKAEQDQQ